MKQKGFAPIIIIVLITLGIAGYFGYRQFKPTINKFLSSLSPTSDPTTNWKTYTNEELGFSIQYPDDLVVKEGYWSRSKTQWDLSFDKRVPDEIQALIREDAGTSQEIDNLKGGGFAYKMAEYQKRLFELGYYSVNIYVDKKPMFSQERITLENFYELETIYVPEAEKFSIQGRPAIKYKNSATATTPNGGGIEIVVLDGDTEIRIRSYAYDLEKVSLSYLDQILSTFKFLDESGKLNNSKYICPANGWVNCMPGPDMPREECSQDAMDWYEENCPDFQGSAV